MVQQSSEVNSISSVDEDVPRAARKSSALLMRVLPIVVFLITGVVAVAPFFSRTEREPGTNEPVRMLWTDDMPNHLAISKQFDKCLKSGVLYPRWLGDINNGYGSAVMIFYPPGFHYLSAFVHVFVADWMNTFFVLAALGLAASGGSFYWLARTFFDRPASLIASLFYTLFPFHLFNFYWQGALPQFLGYAFMPLVFYFAYRVGSKGKLRYYAALGLTYGCYVLTHLPVSYMFTYALAFYAVIWAYRERDLSVVLRIGFGMALGLLLSSIYWLPAAVESRDIYEWASEYMPYHSTYITLLENKDTFGLIVKLSFLLIVGAIVLSTQALRSSSFDGEPFVWPNRYDRRSTYFQLRLWIVLAIGSAFMSTSFSIYVSKLIPKIQIATPAWRWLAVASLFASLLVAAAVQRIPAPVTQASIRVWVYRLAFVVLAALSLWVTLRLSVMDPVRGRESFTIPAQYVDSGFTPKNSTPPASLPDTAMVVLTPPNGVFETLKWEQQHREVVVSVMEAAEVRLKTYDYAGWVARVDGQPTQITTDQDGAQLIAIPPGKHQLETQFVNTLPRTLAVVVSSLGGVLIFGLAFLDLRLLRRSGASSQPEDHSARQPRETASDTEVSITSTPTPLQARRRLFLIAGLAVIICSLGALLAFRIWNRPGRADEKAARASANRSVGQVSTAGESRLVIEGKDSVPLAVDERTLGELIEALSRSNQSAVEALVQSGRVMQIPARTAVKITERGTGKMRVRITEGDHVLAEGWVLEGWIK